MAEEADRHFFSDRLADLANRGVAAFEAFYPLIAWSAKVGSFLGSAFLLASAIYLFIYYNLIGEEVVARDLYFTFDSLCKLTPGTDDGVATSTCSFPLANASLDPTRDEPGSLVYGQAYRVIVQLWLPDSPANSLVGMFLVKLQLYSHGFVPGTASMRPVVLPHRPWLSRLASDFATAAFGFLSGWDAEPRHLSIKMLDDYVENPFAMSTGLLVELQSRRVQVQRASIEFRARLTGMKYIMYAHPILSAWFGVATIAWALLLASAPVLLRRWLNAADTTTIDDDWLNEEVPVGDPHPMRMPDPTRAEAAQGEVRHRQRDID